MRNDERQIIKIKYLDVPPDFSEERHWITRTLEKKYKIEFSENPDFVFYSVFGIKHYDCKNCVRIFFTGEDTIPDFNECDYAMCHDYISFGDRYIRADIGENYGTPIGELKPDWIHTGIGISGWINSSIPDIRPSIQDRTAVDERLLNRRFCNYLYSNTVTGSGMILREQLKEKLSAYKPVDTGKEDIKVKERWKIKDGRRSIDPEWVQDKLDFIRKYKFTIGFENVFLSGHTTEKLIHPLYAYSIPIYWGNPDVDRDFNRKAFINCSDYATLDDVVDRIIELDGDDRQYLDMLRQPPMLENFDYHAEQKAEDFLYHIIEKGNCPYPKGELNFTATGILLRDHQKMQRLRKTAAYRIFRKIRRKSPNNSSG